MHKPPPLFWHVLIAVIALVALTWLMNWQLWGSPW